VSRNIQHKSKFLVGYVKVFIKTVPVPNNFKMSLLLEMLIK